MRSRFWERARDWFGRRRTEQRQRQQQRQQRPEDGVAPPVKAVDEQIEGAATEVEKYARLITMYRRQAIADRGGGNGDHTTRNR